MQNQFPIPHTLLDWFWFFLASFFTIGGSAGFWAWIQNRKKVQAEVRNLDTKSVISAGDAVLRYIDRLSNAEATIIKQKLELAECREKAAEADLLREQLTEAKMLAKYWEGESRKHR